MKSSIKKLLQVGTSLTMLRHEDVEGTDIEFYNKDTGTFSNKRIWLARKIDIRQTNAIKFKWGSWLYFWPAGQSEWIKDWETFRVWDIDIEGNKCCILTYKINKNEI